MLKQIIIGLLFIGIGAGGAVLFLQNKAPAQNDHVHGAEYCSKHKIAESQCPWCDKSLIKTMGMCPGHKVPEALCSRCNSDLIPGFKAENDWCAGHDLPESQCDLCKAGQYPPGEIPKGS